MVGYWQKILNSTFFLEYKCNWIKMRSVVVETLLIFCDRFNPLKGVCLKRRIIKNQILVCYFKQSAVHWFILEFRLWKLWFNCAWRISLSIKKQIQHFNTKFSKGWLLRIVKRLYLYLYLNLYFCGHFCNFFFTKSQNSKMI